MMQNQYQIISSPGNWATSQHKDRLFQVCVSHDKFETVVRPYYLYDGNAYTDKTASLYWDALLLENWHISLELKAFEAPIK